MNTDSTPKTDKALIDEASAWRVLLSDPEVTDGDHRRFDAWLKADPRHEDAFDRVVTVWEGFGRLNQDDLSSDLLRSTVLERARMVRCNLRERTSRLRLQIIAVGAFVAAAVVAVAVVQPWAGSVSDPTAGALILASAETGRAETETVTLADGSQVTLGAMSAVEASFTAEARAVRLVRGAAFFQVAEDPSRPFTVRSGSFEATVIGTAFEIRTAPEIVRLAVAEGSVRASYPLIAGARALSMRNHEVLAAGQQIAAKREEGLGEISPVRPGSVGAFREARLVYDGAPLSELVAEASRYAARPVVIGEGSEDLGALRVRGAFDARDTDAMLSVLSEIYPLNIDRADPDRIVLRARGG